MPPADEPEAGLGVGAGATRVSSADTVAGISGVLVGSGVAVGRGVSVGLGVSVGTGVSVGVTVLVGVGKLAATIAATVALRSGVGVATTKIGVGAGVEVTSTIRTSPEPQASTVIAKNSAR